MSQWGRQALLLALRSAMMDWYCSYACDSCGWTWRHAVSGGGGTCRVQRSCGIVLRVLLFSTTNQGFGQYLLTHALHYQHLIASQQVDAPPSGGGGLAATGGGGAQEAAMRGWAYQAVAALAQRLPEHFQVS